MIGYLALAAFFGLIWFIGWVVDEIKIELKDDDRGD